MGNREINSEITPLDEWTRQKIASPTKLTREALEAYQIAKLRETFDLACSKSRFYQRRLSTLPGRLSSLDDLPRFPFTTAQHLPRTWNANAVRLAE